MTATLVGATGLIGSYFGRIAERSLRYCKFFSPTNRYYSSKLEKKIVDLMTAIHCNTSNTDVLFVLSGHQ
jgi:hypothetical protein